MSRWIRGRLGRPIASMISIMMLVTILLPLAPPPAKAQQEGITDWNALVDMTQTTVIPLAVLDFNNRSGYQSGAISREMADSLALALEGKGAYSVVDRETLDTAMREFNFTVPLSFDAQAILAERLNVPFVITGEIEKVTPQRTKDGTYVEVIVNALVISRITRLPINGARVVQKSSPKLGYVSNNLDPLVQEAIFTAANQLANRIQDNRMPFATVLNPTSNGVVRLRGGSLIGIREGMKLVAVRHESVSGILRVDSVTPIETVCTVIDDMRGVAPSDKVVPFFSLDRYTPTPEKLRERSIAKLLPWAAAGLLVALIGHSGKSAEAAQIQASPVADASPLNYTDGANLVTWQKKGKEILKYIIYRVTNNEPRPIAVVDGKQNWYIDPGYNPIIRDVYGNNKWQTIQEFYGVAREYNIELDPEKNGPILLEDSSEAVLSYWNWTYDHMTGEFDKDDIPDDVITYGVSIDGPSAEIICGDVPLQSGQSCAYMVQPLFYVWTPLGGNNTGDEGGYQLRLGEMSRISDLVTMTAVPTILEPGEGQTGMSGIFSCTAPQYSKGILQLSTDLFFREENTVTITTQPGSNTGFYSQDALYPVDKIVNDPKLAGGSTIYMRMGIKYATNMPARPRQMQSYASDGGYVFSDIRTFNVNRSLRALKNGSPDTMGPVPIFKAPQGRRERLFKR